MNLQFFSEEMGGEPTGVESSVSAAEGQTEASESTEQNESGVNHEGQAAAEPKQNNFEIAFAKRLAAEREKWDSQYQQELSRYQNYDKYEKATQYLLSNSGYSDPDALLEAIEYQQLTERAQQANVPPEVMQRLEQLEQKAQRADQYEQLQQQQQHYQSFRGNLEQFAQQKGVDPNQLHEFMYQNQIANFDMAYKAFKFDEVQQQIENAKKNGVKEFLNAKGSMPTVEGKTATGSPQLAAPKTLADARARAMARLSNWGNMEG